MKQINLRSAFAVAGVAGLAAVSVLGAHAANTDTATAQINGSTGGTGTLTLTSQALVQFAAVNLGGTTTATNANDVLQTVDSTGTGNGFNVTIAATQFASGAHTLPADGLSATGVGTSPATASDSAVSNAVAGTPTSYPLSIPSTAVKLFSADVNSGMGTNNETAAFNLVVPANTYQGGYSSTWTLSIQSAP